MKEFFHSKVFKLFLAIGIVLFALLLRATMTQGASTLFNNALGLVTTPIQKVTASISGVFDRYLHVDEVYEENENLREEIRRLNENQVELEKYRNENESLKEFLEVKEENPDHQYVAAAVVGREPNSRFYAFTIDKGSLDGVEPLDPVITADGLVGRVSEVGLTFSKVTTILDPSVNVGCYNVRTRDMGTVSGDIAAAQEGLCKMELVDRASSSARDDIILTAGSTGLFPKDLIIGKITNIGSESHGKSFYGEIRPAADIQNVKDVLVITSFRGQGSSLEDMQPAVAAPEQEDKNSETGEEEDQAASSGE